MSIIYSYPEQGALNANDMLIGTSAEKVGGKQKNITRNFSVQQIADFINGGAGFIDPVASDFQIAVFNQAGKKITGSIMSQDAFPNGTGITISGNLTTTGNITTPLNLTANGVVSLGGQANLISLNSVTKLGGPIQDATGTLGNVNQILLSNGSGVVTWQNYEAGLTYEGTWDALNNTTNGLSNSPALVQGVGVSGHFYIVNVEGTTSLGPGLNDWHVGDWAIFLDEGGQPASWQKIDNTSTLVGSGTAGTFAKWTNATTLNDSIMSESGTVVSVDGDLKVKDTVEATTTNSNLKLKGNGTGGVEIMSADGVTDGKITLNCSQNSHGVTLQSPPHASGATYTLILPTSFGGAGDVLTSAGANPSQLVWTTPTTGTVTGTGTQNYVTKWSAGGAGIENSTIFDNGTNVGIGTSTPASLLSVRTAGVSGNQDFATFSRGTSTEYEVLKISRSAGSVEFLANQNITLSADYDNDHTGVNSNIILKTDNTERMRIDSSGSVGIGVTSNINGTLTLPNNGIISFHDAVGNARNSLEFSSGELKHGAAGAGLSTQTFFTNGAERMRINSSGNVGIGTTSPSAKLEVAGDIRGTESLIVKDTGGTKSLSLLRELNYATINNGAETLNYNALNHIFLTGLNEKMRINSTGNVGIGTTSPGEKLSVSGNSNITGKLAIGSTSSHASYDFYNQNTSYFNGAVTLDSTFTQTGGGNSSFSGNIGIGTTSPAVSLDISATDAVQMPVGVTGDRPGIGSVSNGMLRYNSSNNGFEGYINGNWGDIGGGTSGGLIFRGTFDASTGAIASGGSLYTCPAGGSGGTVDTAIGDLYIVTTAGSFFCSGTSLNVGDEVICITAATAGNSQFAYWNAVASGAGGAVTGSGTTNYIPKFTGATVVGNSSIFNDAAGNVGIGTGSPSGKLNIQSSASGTYLLNLDYNDGTDGGGFYQSASSGLILFLKDSNSTAKVQIASNGDSYFNGGNLGIGTTSPSYATHIKGTSNFKALKLQGGDQANQYSELGFLPSTVDSVDANIYIRGHRGSDGSFSNNYLTFGTNSSERMRIASDGNVGIGTSSPANLGFLEKSLNISAGSSSSTTLQQAGIVISGSADAADADDFGYLSFTNYQSGITSDRVAEIRALKNGTNVSTGEFAFYTSNGSGPTERMRIDSSGNIGIGTTSPGAKLEVKNGSSGQAYSNVEGILIDTNGNSNSDYSLRIGSSAGNDNLVVTNAGRVGIRTDQPEVSLDLGNNTDAIQLPAGDNTARAAISNPFGGMIRYNTTDDQFEGYSGIGAAGSWGALGSGSGGAGTITTNNFSGNGTVGPFTLGAAPSGGSRSFVDVFIDGVYQEISTYTVSGTALSFAVGSEPPTGTNIQTKTTSGAVSGALVSSVDIGQSTSTTGGVNLRINPIEVTSGQTISGNANSLYIFTATGAQSIATVTLPGSPTLGDSIKISNLGGLANVLGANGNKIMGVAQDLTINTPTAAFEIIWSGSNNGWIIIGNV